MPYRIDLGGRRALVTGGTRGIGLACAQVLGEAGAEVIITARSDAAGQAAQRTLAAEGHDVRFVVMDVADEASVREGFANALGGAPDIVVNNAGIAMHRDTLDADAPHWDAVVGTNYKGVFLCCREAIRAMTAAGRGGAIVNVGSISGLISNIPQNQAVYNSSKAAVHMLTKSLASEFAHARIRVNAVAPGYVRTDMTKSGFERPDWSQVWLDMTPMRRAAEPREIAEAVLFLASDASSYVTGEILTIDGGYTLR